MHQMIMLVVQGSPGLTHNAPRFRHGRSMVKSSSDLTFADDWDSDDNSDAKSMSEAEVYRAIYTDCDSADFQKAVDCKLVTVLKGCHQPGTKQHITVKFEHKTKGLSKKCKENSYLGSSSLHVACDSCTVVVT
jgi:hypothetical protein